MRWIAVRLATVAVLTAYLVILVLQAVLALNRFVLLMADVLLQRAEDGLDHVLDLIGMADKR